MYWYMPVTPMLRGGDRMARRADWPVGMLSPKMRWMDPEEWYLSVCFGLYSCLHVLTYVHMHWHACSPLHRHTQGKKKQSRNKQQIPHGASLLPVLPCHSPLESMILLWFWHSVCYLLTKSSRKWIGLTEARALQPCRSVWHTTVLLGSSSFIWLLDVREREERRKTHISMAGPPRWLKCHFKGILECTER